jgi:hypothetical protein
MIVFANCVVYSCQVHYTGQYYILRMAYRDKIFSDNMVLRPVFVCIIHIYKNNYELATVAAYFCIFLYVIS